MNQAEHTVFRNMAVLLAILCVIVAIGVVWIFATGGQGASSFLGSGALSAR